MISLDGSVQSTAEGGFVVAFDRATRPARRSSLVGTDRIRKFWPTGWVTSSWICAWEAPTSSASASSRWS